jgi:SAM-dependent methyltransferase
MFYPDKIKNIKEEDKVLEIGPGDSPFHRSNVLLELVYTTEADRIKQFGHANALHTNKKIVYYDGNKFPFADNSFDYIICSHVLEHVEDVEFFLSEIFRIAKRGYFEYPLIVYDYLYNFDVHLNFLKFTGKEMLLLKKRETTLNSFKPIQNFFIKTLEKNYGDFLFKIPECFHEGFEWEIPFSIKYSNSLNDFINWDLTTKYQTPIVHTPLKTLFKLILNAVKKRIKNVR